MKVLRNNFFLFLSLSVSLSPFFKCTRTDSLICAIIFCSKQRICLTDIWKRKKKDSYLSVRNVCMYVYWVLNLSQALLKCVSMMGHILWNILENIQILISIVFHYFILYFNTVHWALSYYSFVVQSYKHFYLFHPSEIIKAFHFNHSIHIPISVNFQNFSIKNFSFELFYYS